MSDRREIFEFQKEQEERLDHFLVERLPEFSRSRLQGLIKNGFVLIDGVLAKKAGQKLETGSEVEIHIPPPAPSGLVGEDIPLDIVFENDDLLVINKPAGMVVHPAAGHDTGTLVHAVLGYDPEIEGIGGEKRPRPPLVARPVPPAQGGEDLLGAGGWRASNTQRTGRGAHRTRSQSSQEDGDHATRQGTRSGF